MSDDELVVIMMMTLALSLTVLILMVKNRRLKKKLRAIEAAPVAVATAPAPGQLSADQSAEFQELRKRVQVLERIATDGNPLLDREFEDLRRAG